MGKTACWSHDNHRCHEVFAKCRTGMCVNSTRRALTRLQALLCGGVLHKALGIPDNEGNEKNEHEGITKRGVGGGGSSALVPHTLAEAPRGCCTPLTHR